MIWGDEPASYYDILESQPDATPQELRTAYLRLKAAYAKDSLASYSLIDRNESSGILKQIEDAYEVLSHPERRRLYDRSYETTRSEGTPFGSGEPSNVDESLLFSPTTDFAVGTETSQELHTRGPAGRAEEIRSSPQRLEMNPQLNSLENETEWRGDTLRKVRESLQLSVEEVSETTKISKTYIRAIEDEDYSKLPAAVYLRGFITQVAKKLRLPHDKVAAAYVARYRQACPNKL